MHGSSTPADEPGRPRRLVIVMPVFNDWDSMVLLIRDIEDAMRGSGADIEVVAVDDCSTQPAPEAISTELISRIHLVRLGANVGHQRAIATGLVKVAADMDHDFVAVMDSDGEDRPVELRRLLGAAIAAPDVAFVAQRQKRSEGTGFRVFYWLYTKLFKLLTGQRINFGNFMLLPMWQVRRAVYDPNIWNNVAASVIHSRLPIRHVPTTRGTRYRGRSTMNFVSLVAHGLGAISVFSEAVYVRILVASTVAFFLSVASGVGVLVIRLFTALAVPGWATTVLGFAFLTSVQAVMMPIMMAFLLLNNRSSIQILPKDHAFRLIEETRRLDVAKAPTSTQSS